MVSLPDIPNYEIERLIGEGGSGQVYLARRISGKTVLEPPVAIKLFKIENVHPNTQASRERMNLQERVHSQFTNLAHINHFNLVKMYFPEVYGDSFIVPMEYCNAGTLESYIKELNFSQIHSCVQGIKKGLEYLHNSGLVHRDLKLSNMFINAPRGYKSNRSEGSNLNNDVQIKIGDLESITNIRELMAGSRPSHYAHKYAAPELLKGQSATFKSDLYAFGCCIYYLASRLFPNEDTLITQLNSANNIKTYKTILDSRTISDIIDENFTNSIDPEWQKLWQDIKNPKQWIKETSRSENQYESKEDNNIIHRVLSLIFGKSIALSFQDEFLVNRLLSFNPNKRKLYPFREFLHKINYFEEIRETLLPKKILEK